MTDAYHTRLAAVVVTGAMGLLVLAACDRQPPTGPIRRAAPQTFASVASRTSPPVTSDGAPARALGGPTGALVQLVAIERARGGPSTIDPCWLVNRGIYGADARNGRFAVEFTFTYPSRGVMVTRTFAVDLRDARTEDDDAARGASFVELTIPLDVGDAVPDADGAIDGVVVLVRTTGDQRAVVAESRLTARP